MSSEQLKPLIESGLEGSEVAVTGEGGKFTVRVVSTQFSGLRAVQRQQKVYALIGDLITSGAVHAVSIQAYTPEEWADASRFGASF